MTKDKNELSDGSMRNLDLEERVLYQSRIFRLKTILQAIGGIVSRLLIKKEVRNLSETTKDELKKIRDLTKTNPED